MEIKQRIKEEKKDNIYPIKRNTDRPVNTTLDSESEKDKRRFLLSFQMATELGFMIVIPLLAGTLLGIYLDQRLGTKPIFILVGVAVGIAVSVVSIVRIIGSLIDS